MKTLFLCCALALTTVGLRAQSSTIAVSNHYAWAGNFGWVDFRADRPNPGDGFRFGEYFCSGWLWAPDLGWIHCGNGAPSNQVHYANTNGTDFGVNHSGNGDLSGLAWAANAGWINFGWWQTNPANANRPCVELASGNFTGYAWSANCGWINLGTSRLKTDSMAVTDTDGDGIADAYEMAHAGDLSLMDATSDKDGDGFSDKAEYFAMTDPFDAGSHIQITAIEQINSDGSATALTWDSSPARRYIIEGTPALGGTNTWQSSPLDPPSFAADPGAETTRKTQDTPAENRFFRVRPVIPLQP